MNNIDIGFIAEAIREHFRFHTGECLMSEESFIKYYLQVKMILEYVESLDLEGFQNLTVLELAFKACEKQVISES